MPDTLARSPVVRVSDRVFVARELCEVTLLRSARMPRAGVPLP